MIKRLKDVVDLSTLLSTGYIFTRIRNTFSSSFTWMTPDMAKMLDEKLVLEHSGDKYISPYYDKVLDKINNPDYIVARNIVLTYEDKWDKIHNALMTDYEPLDNYNMVEVETPDITREKTTDVKTKMVTSSSGDSSSDVYGFNSANATPSTENSASTEVTVSGDNDENVSHDLETESGTRELTRHGNIGVTTSQQMLESEIELRNKNIFVNMLLNDVSKILCLSVY